MNNEKNRNEINLSTEVLAILKEKASKDNRSLKNYLEKILTKHALGFKPKENKTKV